MEGMMKYVVLLSLLMQLGSAVSLDDTVKRPLDPILNTRFKKGDYACRDAIESKCMRGSKESSIRLQEGVSGEDVHQESQTNNTAPHVMHMPECAGSLTNISPILINQIDKHGEECVHEIGNVSSSIKVLSKQQKSINEELAEINKKGCDALDEQVALLETLVKERASICSECRKVIEEYSLLLKKQHLRLREQVRTSLQKDRLSQERLDQARQMLSCLQEQLLQDALRNKQAREELLETIEKQRRNEERFDSSLAKDKCEIERLNRYNVILKQDLKDAISASHCRDCEIGRLRQIIGLKEAEILQLQHDLAKEKEKNIILEKEVDCLKSDNEAAQKLTRENCQETSAYKRKCKELEQKLKQTDINMETQSNAEKLEKFDLVILDEKDKCQGHKQKLNERHREALRQEYMEESAENLRFRQTREKGCPHISRKGCPPCSCANHTEGYEFIKEFLGAANTLQCRLKAFEEQRKKKEQESKKQQDQEDYDMMQPSFAQWYDVADPVVVGDSEKIFPEGIQGGPVDPYEICRGYKYFPKRPCSDCNLHEEDGVRSSPSGRNKYLQKSVCEYGIVKLMWRSGDKNCTTYQVALQGGEKNSPGAILEGSRLDRMIKDLIDRKHVTLTSSTDEKYLFDFDAGVMYTGNRKLIKLIKGPVLDYRGPDTLSVVLESEGTKNPFTRHGVTQGQVLEVAKSILEYDSASVYINEEHKIRVTNAEDGSEVKPTGDKPEKFFIVKSISKKALKKVHDQDFRVCEKESRVLHDPEDFSVRCFGGYFHRNNELTDLVLQGGKLSGKYKGGKYNVEFTFDGSTYDLLYSLSQSGISNWPIRTG